MTTCTCLRCGHKWTSKQVRPRECPKCGVLYWDMVKKPRRLYGQKLRTKNESGNAGKEETC
jgi:predicted  nucleic acid-binding Zn-ribbon protein